MKLIKYIFAALVFFSFNAIAETRIIFLNGIDGNVTKNSVSTAKLKSIVEKSGYGGKFDATGTKYIFWSNPGDGFFDDKIELLAQAKLSGQALTKAQLTDPSVKADGGQLYSDTLGALYADKISNGAADEENARHVYSVVKNFSAFLEDEIITRKNKVIVVAHSQGNFFSEAVAGYISVGKSAEINQLLNNNLRFVGVASVAASTPSGRYISTREDNALDAHYLATLAVSNFSILPRNIKFCADLDIVCKPYLEATIDLTIHGFQETYTSDLYDKISGKQVYKMLADMVNDSYVEINPPTPAPLTVLSAFQAGTYDYSTDMQCYYKNTLGSSVGTNEYAVSETKYCLNSAKNAWVQTVDDAGLLLLPNGRWVSGNSPNLVITGDNSFTSNFGGYAFQSGTFTQNTVGSNYPSGSTSGTVSLTETRDRYMLWNITNNSYVYNNTTGLDSLIATWNASFNGQATLSQTNKYGWSFVTPPVSDYTAGIYKLYDISQQPTCTTTGGVTTCGRPVLAQGAWTKNILSDGSPAIELNVYSPYTDLLLFGNTGQRALYVKRASDSGVREGAHKLAGGTRSFNSVNRTYMNADLAARGYPTTVN